jgi:hypothetical protein
MPHAGQGVKPMVKLGRKADDCWTWLGALGSEGHGKKTFAGRDIMAHRWLWEQLFGRIPPGLVIYTTCESKACINPHHLACGTQAEACRNSVQTKLLPSDVLEIQMAKEDAGPNTAPQLAAKFDVQVAAIHAIWRGTTWRRGKHFRGPKQPRNQYTRVVANG